jgi:hypothetical protein
MEIFTTGTLIYYGNFYHGNLDLDRKFWHKESRSCTENFTNRIIDLQEPWPCTEALTYRNLDLPGKHWPSGTLTFKGSTGLQEPWPCAELWSTGALTLQGNFDIKEPWPCGETSDHRNLDLAGKLLGINREKGGLSSGSDRSRRLWPITYPGN